MIVTAYSIWFFIGFSNASGSQNNYLEGLETKSEVVTEYFRDKNITCDYSTQSHTFTVKEKDVTYSFTDSGFSKIDTISAIITINDLSKDGKVKAIDISYGNGFEATRVKYNMSNLDRPTAYYFGSDVKNDDAIIKKVLPDSKIQEYVNQGERYQAEIRKVVFE